MYPPCGGGWPRWAQEREQLASQAKAAAQAITNLRLEMDQSHDTNAALEADVARLTGEVERLKEVAEAKPIGEDIHSWIDTWERRRGHSTPELDPLETLTSVPALHATVPSRHHNTHRYRSDFDRL